MDKSFVITYMKVDITVTSKGETVAKEHQLASISSPDPPFSFSDFILYVIASWQELAVKDGVYQQDQSPTFVGIMDKRASKSFLV